MAANTTINQQNLGLVFTDGLNLENEANFPQFTIQSYEYVTAALGVYTAEDGLTAVTTVVAGADVYYIATLTANVGTAGGTLTGFSLTLSAENFENVQYKIGTGSYVAFTSPVTGLTTAIADGTPVKVYIKATTVVPASKTV